MGRRKCVLIACPHHHYSMEKIGGNRVTTHAFPRRDYPTWMKWCQFVILHNGSLDEEDRNTHFMCSAHFQPHFIKSEGTLSLHAVPTISPEFVRQLAIKNGDVSKIYPLPKKVKPRKPSSAVIFLNAVVEGSPQEQQIPSPQQSSSENPPRKKRLGDLCACEFTCPVQRKVGLQIINDTLRIWGGLGKLNDKQKVECKALKDSEKIEVEEKCEGRCYHR